VAHHDKRPFAGLGNVHLDSVGIDETMIEFNH
jgi:hypothetical protein